MARRCQICGKKALGGNRVSRRGLAKKKGGVGKKTTATTKRKFFPNLQKRKIIINGKPKRILICTKCIKKGRLTSNLISNL